jgi:hypothetical protein
LGNVSVFAAYFFGSVLVTQIVPETKHHLSAFVVAPVLLMLHEDGFAFESLRGARRYAPPVAAAGARLLAAALAEAFAEHAGARESGLRAAAHAAWGGSRDGNGIFWRGLIVEIFLAIAAVPGTWRLVEYLWSPSRRAGVSETAMTAPLAALTLAATESSAAKTLAVTSLCAAVAQHVAQNSAKRAGMRAL